MEEATPLLEEATQLTKEITPLLQVRWPVPGGPGDERGLEARVGVHACNPAHPTVVCVVTHVGKCVHMG